jgi:tetratricopeptide (TPR) repeat protein
MEGGTAEAHTLRGLARMRRRDFAGAGEDFERATVLDPSHSAAWFNAALALERQGKSAEAAAARSTFEKAQELENALHQMEVAYHSNSENLDAGIELAGLLRRAGRTREATVLLETLTMDRPDDPRASIFLSEIAAEEGLLERAQDAARRAVEIAPNHPRALVALSNALAEDNPSEALASARRAVEVAPRAAPAHVALGNRLLEGGDAPGALREFQLAREILPEDVSLLGRVGVAMARAEAWEDAEPLLSMALSRQGPNAEWLLHRGLAHEGMKSPTRAAEDFRLAIDADPANARAYPVLARALRAMNQDAEADSIEQRGAKIAQLEEDVREVRASLAKEPANEKKARHLARLLEEEGRSDEAARVLASALDPGFEP